MPTHSSKTGKVLVSRKHHRYQGRAGSKTVTLTLPFKGKYRESTAERSNLFKARLPLKNELKPARSTSHGWYPLPNLKRSLVTISMRKISPGSKWQERHPRDTRRLLFYVFVFVGFLFAFCLSMGDSLSNGIVILCCLVLVASFFLRGHGGFFLRSCLNEIRSILLFLGNHPESVFFIVAAAS